MSTYFFDDVALDEGDMGIQWIPGIGFRPVDITEEMPGKELCGQIVGDKSCHTGKCPEKWALTEKWEPPLEFWPEPPVYIAPPVWYPNTPPIWVGTPVWFNDPPVYWCCGSSNPPPPPPLCCTHQPPYEPPHEPPPDVVPLPPSLFMLLAGLLLLKRISA